MHAVNSYFSTIHIQGANTKFTFIHPPNDSKTFALYTEIDDDSKQRVYLLPQVDDTQIGQRRYVIRAVQTKNQDQEGKSFNLNLIETESTIHFVALYKEYNIS